MLTKETKRLVSETIEILELASLTEFKNELVKFIDSQTESTEFHIQRVNKLSHTKEVIYSFNHNVLCKCKVGVKMAKKILKAKYNG